MESTVALRCRRIRELQDASPESIQAKRERLRKRRTRASTDKGTKKLVRCFEGREFATLSFACAAGRLTSPFWGILTRESTDEHGFA